MINKLRENKDILFTIICTTVVAIVFCICKTTMNIDESQSYALANKIEGLVRFDYPTWLEKDFFQHFEARDYLFDYQWVWRNQRFDCHPPFFYAILHTICSIFKGKLNIWFGLIINITCSIINTLIISLFFKKKNINKLTTLIVCLILVSSVLFTPELTNTRMYYLLLTETIVLFSIANSLVEKNASVLKYLLLSLTIICGCLTHYYFYFGLLVIALSSLFSLIGKKKYKELIIAVMVCVISCLIALTIFPYVFDHLKGESHGLYATSTLSNFSLNISVINYYLSNICSNVYTSYLFILSIVIISILFLQKKNNNLFFPLIVLFSLAGIIVISQVSDLVEKRYIIHLVAITILSVVVMIDEMFDGRVVLIFVALIFVLNFNLKALKNISKEKSWDFAKSKQDNIALVVTNGDIDPHAINVQFLDYRNYLAVGVTEMWADFEFDYDKEFILYKQIGISKDDVETYIESLLNKDVELIKETLDSDVFSIYIVKTK